MDDKEIKRVAIYTRVSKDAEAGTDQGRAAVKRYEAASRKEAARRGWTIVGPSRSLDKTGVIPEVYEDNSISASQYAKKVRPAYRLMMEDARAGRFDAIISYGLDRLTRQPREFEDILDLIDETGIKVVTLSGEIDLHTPNGRMVGGMLANFARGEMDEKSRKQKFANATRRSEGQFYRGMTPTGYIRGAVKVVTGEDGSFTVHRMDEEIKGDYEVQPKALVPDPEVEAHIRSGFEMVLNGDPLRKIADTWDADGFKPPRAERWSLTTVHKLLASPTMAAIQTFEGREIGPGKWIGYISPEEYRDVLKSLASRRKSHGVRQPKEEYLLTGILQCSCGRHMTGNRAYKGMLYYRCSGRALGKENGGCTRSVALEQAHGKIFGHVVNTLVTMNPKDLIPEETRVRQEELARQLVRIGADRRAVKGNNKLSVMSKAELYQELDEEEQQALEAVRRLDAEDSLSRLITYVLPWIEDGRGPLEALSRSAQSVRERFEELGMIQQRIVVDALGYYKLGEGVRGRWTVVEVYPKDPLTGQVSPYSTDENPLGSFSINLTPYVSLKGLERKPVKPGEPGESSAWPKDLPTSNAVGLELLKGMGLEP